MSPDPTSSDPPSDSSKLNRRRFVQNFSMLASGLSTLGFWTGGSEAKSSKDDKLNIAFVGPGGRGASNLAGMASENIVALCDVDQNSARAAFQRYPKSNHYRDYRIMLERESGLDAVVVSTPDHTHASVALAAMKKGLHVYCEKPLGHSIYEIRQMSKVARETGVTTQMGTQGHAMEGSRRAVEVIRGGLLGKVRELHVWTDRPNGWWPQGEDRPSEQPPVPKTLDWDLWLGPAPYRPYHPVYVPFKWRGRWDFGTGAIGDMGVHNLDTAFWALELGTPTSAVVVESGPKTEDCPPPWSVTEIEYPSRASQPAVKLTFYDGKKLPPAELFHGEPIPSNGSLVIGEFGTLLTRTWHGGQTEADMFMLLPKKKPADLQLPPVTLPRTRDHHHEFVMACKGGPKTESHFEYAARLTEGLLVGSLALRTGKPIHWNAEKMIAEGVPEANRLIHPTFRPGWGLD